MRETPMDSGASWLEVSMMKDWAVKKTSIVLECVDIEATVQRMKEKGGSDRSIRIKRRSLLISIQRKIWNYTLHRINWMLSCRERDLLRFIHFQPLSQLFAQLGARYNSVHNQL